VFRFVMEVVDLFGSKEVLKKGHRVLKLKIETTKMAIVEGKVCG
jgi:hypothetical protein